MIQRKTQVGILALVLGVAATCRFIHQPSPNRVILEEGSVLLTTFEQPPDTDPGTPDDRSPSGAAGHYFPYPPFAPVGASVSSSTFSLREWIDETIDFERTSELPNQKGDIDR